MPFVETGIRFTKRLAGKDALGDRMFLLKIRIIDNSKYLPSLAIGAQDFFHATENVTNRFNSLYIVATKNNNFNMILDKVSLTLGYGVDWIKASGYEYQGLWGGVSFSFFKSIEIMGEYDSKYFNSGLRLNLFDHISIISGVIDMKYFSGGVSLSFII